MTATRRFWVEVTPRFASELSAPPVASEEMAAPRLTELAVAVGLEGAELDAELTSVRRQRSTLAAYEAGLIERRATLGAAHTLPFPVLAPTHAPVRTTHQTRPFRQPTTSCPTRSRCC